MFNVDEDIRNADFTKKTWDLTVGFDKSIPGDGGLRFVETLDDFLLYLRVHRKGRGDQVMAVRRFLRLPVANAMPSKLAEDVLDFLGGEGTG